MRVGRSQVSHVAHDPTRVRLAADIHYESRWVPSERLWFEFDHELIDSVSMNGNPWLLAALPLAFVRGEDLSIENGVDATLLAKARKLQTVWAEWYPQFRPVAIDAEETVAEIRPVRGSAAFFSGGVDSFYTILHQRASGEPPIDHLLFVHGFDIPIDNQEGWGQALRSVRALSQAWNTPLLTTTTNLRETRFEQVNWNLLGSGPALGAVGLLLEGLFEKIYISATWSGKALHPLGSHPRTDPLYSTQFTTFVHYGDWVDRIPKTEFISQDSLARRHLRVCWESTEGSNCGRCLKCMRTMLALEINGTLEESSAFPANKVDLDAVRRLYLGREWRYFKHLLPYARQHGRNDIAEAIDAAFARTARIDRLLGAGFLWRGRSRLMMAPSARQALSPILHRVRRAARWIVRRLP